LSQKLATKNLKLNNNHPGSFPKKVILGEPNFGRPKDRTQRITRPIIIWPKGNFKGTKGNPFLGKKPFLKEGLKRRTFK